jgi:hypothetical protein
VVNLSPLDILMRGEGAEVMWGIVSALGIDQTLQNLLSQRALNTTYTNASGRTIYVHVRGSAAAGVGGALVGFVDGIMIHGVSEKNDDVNVPYSTVFLLVLPGASYRIENSTSFVSPQVISWQELR